MKGVYMQYLKICLLISLLISILCFPLISIGESSPSNKTQPTPPPAPPPPEDPAQATALTPIRSVGPGMFEIGSVLINKSKSLVEFPATVNMNKGLLEYLIVGETGKVHESLIRTKVKPYDLQIALLLLGLEGSDNPNREQGYQEIPKGDPVSVKVRWKNKNKQETIPIENWIINKANNKSMKPMGWIFTGSVIWDGVFMAQVEKSIMAIFRDPTAMIDNPLPGGTSDEVWFVNEKATPQPGTDVTVIIEKK